ncbi:MAG: DUF4124 domain-containing protein [Candidatus Accumulibacter sp.]|nr:DUF4124 domain-containing protein [Accumulibacter sp.]
MPSKRTLLSFLAALCLALPASAEIYQWKDPSGKTVISDRPPADQAHARKLTGANSAAQADPRQPSLAERDMEFRKRQKEAQEKAEQAAREETAAAERSGDCQAARRQLAALESGERIALRDDKGERYFLDDAQREREAARTRRFLETQCPQ